MIILGVVLLIVGFLTGIPIIWTLGIIALVIGVILPRTVDAAVESIRICREYDAPVLSRGGGTSLAGQCTNAAVVIDWSKYCHRVPDIDTDARTCTVEPGIVLDVLNNEHLKPYGLRFGPEPATHMNCTLG